MRSVSSSIKFFLLVVSGFPLLMSPYSCTLHSTSDYRKGNRFYFVMCVISETPTWQPKQSVDRRCACNAATNGNGNRRQPRLAGRVQWTRQPPGHLGRNGYPCRPRRCGTHNPAFAMVAFIPATTRGVLTFPLVAASYTRSLSPLSRVPLRYCLLETVSHSCLRRS